MGLLGGTFDPVHCGHLAAAEAARDQLHLDRVLMVVANDPWQKAPQHPVTPAADRLAMVEAACQGRHGLEVSTAEIDRGGPSYTVETVEALVAEAEAAGRPSPEIYLIVGADLVPTLPTWHRVDDLAGLVTLAVVSRPGTTRPTSLQGWRSCRVRGVEVDVSSSEVRRRVAEGSPVEGMVPGAVIRCIRRHDLYAGGG